TFQWVEPTAKFLYAIAQLIAYKRFKQKILKLADENEKLYAITKEEKYRKHAEKLRAIANNDNELMVLFARWLSIKW
ncbi:MAG: hypothetical protein DSY42_06655, partial [Aquifex sp.]